MSTGEIRNARDARRLLGLADSASLDEVRRAFRAAVREAHPDRGGDATRLRRVVDAHRLLTDLHAARQHLTTRAPPMAPAAPQPATPIPLELTVAEAVQGGDKIITLPDGRQGRLKLPPGLRARDTVRLKTDAQPVLFRVRFAKGELEVRGDNIWMTLPVAPRLLKEGGRLEVDTPLGRRLVHVPPEGGDSGVVRLQGQGLPARGEHAEGHLILRLKADETLERSTARSLLRRFTAAWAA